ncbi:F-box/LRR-repeat protein At4g14103-like [Papaver somniferum]|uniref:F-box/LRR-repeat protein At4g14103-like n=1 Tax=Papaver somniferum TaxID=3469 RepID=UPI000E6FFD9E|nr:F-box/LRR-repeat protein At4g14103-like [Papaver somniferum]
MGLNNIGEAEDRISELPDSLLHRILSSLDIKHVARTSFLSKRWSRIWTSFPTLVFPNLYHKSEINKFMDFVDRTLRLPDASSNIQKVHIYMNKHFNAYRVHSWISNVTERDVEELNLWLNQREPFLIPLSLFTCKSLITLELTASFIPLSIFLKVSLYQNSRALHFVDSSLSTIAGMGYTFLIAMSLKI